MSNKFYTIDDFPKTAREKINADGQIYKDFCSGSIKTKTNINYSSIFTRLIQEAGRWCESYASDLFIDLYSLIKKFENGEFENEILLFGFRNSGVDHNNFLLARFNEEKYYANNIYSSIWRLDIVINNKKDNISMELCRVK